MKIYITPEARAVLGVYVDSVNGEVSGLGTAQVIEGKIVIGDILLLHQESSATSTDIKPEAIDLLMTELMQSGEDPSMLKVWWHSHDTMGAFWSSTDEDTIDNFANDWMVSLVINKKGESKCRLDVYEPVHLQADAELEIMWPDLMTAEFKNTLKKEVEEKVTPRSWAYMGQGGYGQPYAGQNGWLPSHYLGKKEEEKKEVKVERVRPRGLDCGLYSLDDDDDDDIPKDPLDPRWKYYDNWG